jgi:hypothetical protein
MKLIDERQNVFGPCAAAMHHQHREFRAIQRLAGHAHSLFGVWVFGRAFRCCH